MARPRSASSPRPVAPRLRSAGVSLLTSALDAGLFALATLLWAGPVLLHARWLCGLAGAAANFGLNRAWAFGGARSAPLGPQARAYALTAALSITLATACWALLRTLTPWDPRLLHLLSLAAVWLCVSFPLYRAWVFQSRGRPEVSIRARITAPTPKCRSSSRGTRA